jgi:hypothetical protein
MKKLPTVCLCIPRYRLGVVLLATLTGLGCGGRRSEVSGTVTYRGKPLEIGTVTFLDDNKLVLGSGAIADGKYSIAKLPRGPVKIVVTTPPQVPANLRALSAPAGKTLPKGKQMEEEKHLSPEERKALPRGFRVPPHVVIPEKYANPDKSGLSYTVQPGSQEHNIELE